MSLKARIEELAAQFADGVLSALREASLEDLLAGGSSTAAKPVGRPGTRRGAPETVHVASAVTPKSTRTKGGRLARRSASDLQHVTGLIVAKLGEHKMGLRSEQLQKALKLSKQEITGPIAAALSSKKIVKTGERRATTYFAR